MRATKTPNTQPADQTDDADDGPESGTRNVTSPSLRQFENPVSEVDFAELDDGSLVELVEDSQDSTRTLLAVWKNGELDYTDRLLHRGQILVPLQRNGEILRRVRLPRDAKAYESVPSLLREILTLFKRCVVLDRPSTLTLATFVLSTWLVDRLPIAPYVSIVGLPQSGKTTLLKVLSLVCRRPLLTADITSAAFYQACGQLTPTLLIDETGTHGNNRALRHLLRMGTTRDVVAVRKNQTFNAYGAKVICWLEPPDDTALNSRCVLIPLKEANNVNLTKPTDPELSRQADELQGKLLRFRLDSYRTLRLPTIPGEEKLRPRTRDLLHCLAAPCAEDKEIGQFLLGVFERLAQVTQEPLPPAQDAVLRALFYLAHQSLNSEIVLVADLTKMVNDLLEKAGERLRLQPRKVGAVLTSLGFINRSRTNVGWTVALNRSRREYVHDLVQTYGIERLKLELPIPLEECSLCAKRSIQDEGVVTVGFTNNIGFLGRET